jgi:hypothetical protein
LGQAGELLQLAHSIKQGCQPRGPPEAEKDRTWINENTMAHFPSGMKLLCTIVVRMALLLQMISDAHFVSMASDIHFTMARHL